MIGIWMVYAVLVGGLFAVAARAAESLLAALGRPTRWAWTLGIAGSVFAPLLALWLTSRPTTPPLPVFGVVLMPEMPVAIGAPTSTGLAWETAAAWLWGGVAGALLLWLASGWIRLALELRRSRPAVVVGQPVAVTETLGPAVTVGPGRRIVLPDWLLSEPRRTLETVVAHEREHLRARDPELLLAALIPAILMPWNPALWIQWFRLRLAVEVDCDRRVLSAKGLDAATYGRVLLRIGERAGGRRIPMAAFSERRTELERRLETMMTTKDRGLVVMAGLGFVAGGLTVAAFLMPRPGGTPAEAPPPPVAVEASPAPEAPLPPPAPGEARPDISDAPVFTPFSVRPEITNVQAVIRAMEESYPPLLRDAGIGGRVVMWFFVDEEGKVGDTRISQTSGHAALDEAALNVAAVYRFSPALNRNEPVPVWVQFPITFEVSGVRESEPVEVVNDEQAAKFDEAPRILNPREAARAMESEYPPILRDAGIGGRTVVWAYLNTDGAIEDVRIDESSGHSALDEASIRVVRTYRFFPARLGGEAVDVWIKLPITFQPR